jgi:hypothetical protein
MSEGSTGAMDQSKPFSILGLSWKGIEEIIPDRLRKPRHHRKNELCRSGEASQFPNEDTGTFPFYQI